MSNPSNDTGKRPRRRGRPVSPFGKLSPISIALPDYQLDFVKALRQQHHAQSEAEIFRWIIKAVQDNPAFLNSQVIQPMLELMGERKPVRSTAKLSVETEAPVREIERLEAREAERTEAK